MELNPDQNLDLAGYVAQAMALSPAWGVVLALFAFCWVVQLYFWLGPLRKLAVYKPATEPATSAKFAPISVVVCCHNHLPGLQALLHALKQQSHPNFEIVVVDDRSDDDTYDWLLAEGKKPNPDFKLVRVNQRPDHIAGKKYALTLGIKAASHNALLLTDADCLPTSPHWVARMAAALETNQPDAVLGYAPLAKVPGLLNLVIRYDTFFTGLQYLGFALVGKPYMGVGRNLAYNKQLFFDTKGFSAHASQTGGDDDLFINQAVWEGAAKSISICVHPEAQTVSAAKATFKTWFWQKMRHLSAGKQYHVKDRTKLGLLQGSYIGFYGLGLALLAAPPLGVPVGLAFALRLLPVWLIQFRAARRLAEPIPTLAMPLLDAWLPIYYLFFGIPALFLKKVAWA